MPPSDMDPSQGDGPDGSSIKPVSSLLARFENISKTQDPPPQPVFRSISPAPKPSKLRDFKPSQAPSPSILPKPEDRPAPAVAQLLRPQSTGPAPAPPLPSTRPQIAAKPRIPSLAPPAVTLIPPQSPPIGKVPSPITLVEQSSYLNPDALASPSTPNASSRQFKIPSRPHTPSSVPILSRPPRAGAAPPPSPPPPRRSAELRRDREGKAAPPPPPTPRSEKPLIPANKPGRASGTTSRESHRGDVSNETSPFGSPPTAQEEEFNGPRPDLPTRPRPKSYIASSSRQTSLGPGFAPPPVHHSVAVRRKDNDGGSSSQSQSLDEDRRPNLPVRPHTFEPPPTRTSSNHTAQHAQPPTSRSTLANNQAPETTSGQAPQKRISSNPTVRSMPPPPSRSHARSQTIDRTSERAPQEFRVPPVAITAVSRPPQAAASGFQAKAEPVEQVTTYPDGSAANRRPPFMRRGCYEINTKYDPRVFDICGEYVCTSGNLTRVWSVLDGELLMSLSHTEGVRATAVCFKPAANPQDEGAKIWIGTNQGELMEVDIATHAISVSKPSVHSRCEVVKIYRHLNELWTLDEVGTLHVWGPDSTGVPNLNENPRQSHKLPRGTTFSMVVGHELWHATGKEVRVFAPGLDASAQFQVLIRPLIAEGAGEVTAGTQISTQPGKVFFGHADGKISVYSTSDYTCQAVLNISTWKINALAGLGGYIWAGYNNGNITVYDIGTSPWVVLKEWHGHDNPVLKMKADPASSYRLGRLQVVSLGGDSKIKIWDGMLEEDWLEEKMKSQDKEYCNFDEIKALVFTWNAGASTPHGLRYSGSDATFFQELVQSSGSPDILIFGFQELVDLEDKTATAKRILKVKKKEGTVQEKMSHQYRDWRDFLLKTLDDYMPAEDLYHLLHTAPMVGLFTCVFVKASLRERIRNLSGAEIKRGMGGVYGNKGAVAVRFQVDDTSLCFVNCHLAAGQSQAAARNNDINAILETGVFPAERDPDARIDTYTGGGDGTLILDHELCIVNGDLNYRIDTMSRDTVVTAVKQNNLSKLLDRDQLLVARRRNPGLRLRAFDELPITFAPTYKYDVGTDTYDTSEKRRSPAWCDRLLFRGRGRIQQLDYRRHEVRVSDHRPVSGRFRLWVKKIDPKKRAVAWMETQQSFEDVRLRELGDEKLFYLMYTCGFDEATSKRLIQEKSSRRPSRSPSRA